VERRLLDRSPALEKPERRRLRALSEIDGDGEMTEEERAEATGSSNVARGSRATQLAGGSPCIVVIGCGAIAESYYLPALARHPNVMKNLILVDRDFARAKKIAASFKVERCLADYRGALNIADGVIIALPTDLHYPVTMDFLAQGVHVLCEKPVAECASKAREMVNQAKMTGAVLAVNYLQRLWPQFAIVKELLVAGTLGEPVFVKYAVGELFDWPTVSGFYFRTGASAGGVLRDRGAHVLDHICWWLGGKPTPISSENDSFGGGEAVARVRFEYNGCHGEIELSWLSSFPCMFRVTCESGEVVGDVYDFRSVLLKSESGRKQRVKLNAPEKSKSDVALKVVENFINVIDIGEDPLVSGGEVLDSVQFADECYEKATRFDMPWYDMLGGWGVS
jgi:UDP-N-acetylglucosamine 3-dehydrogenase